MNEETISLQHRTAEKLQQQDERLDKVDRNLDVIEHNNKESQKAINTIKRPIWTAIKGIFTFGGSKSKPKAATAAGTSEEIGQDFDVIEVHERIGWNAPDNSLADTNFNVINAAESRQEPLSEIQEQQLEKRAQMNALIDQVREMKGNNQNIGTAIQNSNARLDNVTKRIEKSSDKTKQLSSQCDKILKK